MIINKHIGFTGTQKGMTPTQASGVHGALLSFYLMGATHFHHGDCIGADAEAHDIANKIGYITVGHPPIDSLKRAYKLCSVFECAKPYLERNKNIVNACDVVIVVPRTKHQIRRSGTWSTYRYAKEQHKGTLLFLP